MDPGSYKDYLILFLILVLIVLLPYIIKVLYFKIVGKQKGKDQRKRHTSIELSCEGPTNENRKSEGGERKHPKFWIDV